MVQFWQKDLINKLIVLVGLIILVGVGVLVYLLVDTPGGKTFLASFSPSSTPSVQEIFKQGAETSTAKAVLTGTALVPTITTQPFTPMVKDTSTPTPTLVGIVPPATPTPTSTPSASSTPTRRAISTNGKCPPGKIVQVGKVVDVVDGNTVRVLIGELVFVVRYIGVDVPKDENFAQLSAAINAKTVYAKEVKLYSDTSDKDDNNRLLRYVVVGDSLLVNQELIQQGLATAGTSSYACAEDFAAAEQSAKTDRSGIWKAAQP